MPKKYNPVVSSTSYSSRVTAQTCSSVVNSVYIDVNYEDEVISKPVSDRCKPLVAPVSTNDFDNSLYQNTQGAPHVLWKKGTCL
jgi:hypothetical protein